MTLEFSDSYNNCPEYFDYLYTKMRKLSEHFCIMIIIPNPTKPKLWFPIYLSRVGELLDLSLRIRLIILGKY